METETAADFRRDTAVERTAGGRYATTIHPPWSGPPGPNGGYVAALVLRAIRAEVGDPERLPRSLTIHYLRPPSNGAAEIQVEIERSGRTATSCSARVRQEGEVKCIALSVLSGEFPAEVEWSSPPPPASPPESVEPLDTSFLPPRIFAQLEMRMLFGGIPFTESEGVSGGWVRTRVPAPLEPELLAMYTDSWWPALFPRLSVPMLAPTLDLTIHFRGTPPPGEREHVLCRFVSGTSAHGFFEEDGELWSADGTLLAQSRQLGLIRPWPD